MGKIIQFDSSRKNPPTGDAATGKGCPHKQVTAYTYYRTVRCSICGQELDPFDVLVDMLKTDVPGGQGKREEERLLREMERRDHQKAPEDESGPE